MSSEKPIYEFAIKEERVDRAIRVIEAHAKGRPYAPPVRSIEVTFASPEEEALVTSALAAKGISYRDTSKPESPELHPLNLDTVFDLFHELDWSHRISYSAESTMDNERLQLDLTDIQCVALAAAFAAVYEVQGIRRLAT